MEVRGPLANRSGRCQPMAKLLSPSQALRQARAGAVTCAVAHAPPELPLVPPAVGPGVDPWSHEHWSNFRVKRGSTTTGQILVEH